MAESFGAGGNFGIWGALVLSLFQWADGLALTRCMVMPESESPAAAGTVSSSPFHGQEAPLLDSLSLAKLMHMECFLQS